MVQKTKAAETPELSQEDIQKIKKIIIERVWVDESEIIPEASLKDDLDFDSLDFIELIMVLEKIFAFILIMRKWKTSKPSQTFTRPSQ